MNIIDIIGITVVGSYLALVAASNKSVRKVAKVSAKSVAGSFMLVERAYENYLEANDEETEEVMKAIKQKAKHKKMRVQIEEPEEHEFVL